jgi:hypothetical protein
MDTDALIAHSRARFDHVTARRILKEKYQARLLFAHNGGMFRVTPELLAFVAYWPIDELYLEDLYGNPVEVDRSVFQIQAQQHFHQQMNAWHTEFAELNKKR